MEKNVSKILVADDSILARKQLKDLLSLTGTYEFIDAADGEQAVDLYQEHVPDLVFLDIVMPKMDGNAAIRKIMEFDPNAVIVVCSSVGTQSQLKDCLEVGAHDFIQKPISKDSVVELVTKIIKGK